MTDAVSPSVSVLEEPENQSRSAVRRFIRRFLAERLAVVALGFLVFLAVVAAFAPLLAPHDPNAQELSLSLADPLSPGRVLGADELGRDQLSRIIFATRIALVAVVQAVAVGLIIGVPPGLLAGFVGGKVDLVVMRITDTVMSFPPLILAIAIVGALGPGLTNAMLAIGIVFAPTFLRIVRGETLRVRSETYVEAARSLGTSSPRIVIRHVFPNILPPLLVQVSLAGAFALLAEAGLSFLGLGVQPPDSSWGSMLGRGYRSLAIQPWLVVFPGLAVASTVLALNVLGDGLRDSIGREVRRVK